MSVYYNEIDPFAVQWLRNLMAAGHIPEGFIDTRPIQEVQPDDVRDYTQCHFFAGIGGWAYALQLAGWPVDRPVWTGSCPCQPFSVAGQGKGGDDPRHLWPFWFALIRQLHPRSVFGEQVAGAIQHGWLDLVQGDLEAEGYAVGAAVLGAHSVGAPHKRQRLWFVADAAGNRAARYASKEDCQRQSFGPESGGSGLLGDKPEQSAGAERRESVRDNGTDGVVGVAHDAGSQGHGRLVGVNDAEGRQGAERHLRASDVRIGLLADAERGRCEQRNAGERRVPVTYAHGDVNYGFWYNYTTIPCTDGKSRPIEPSIFPLADGLPGRVGQLRAAGNAIVPQVAAAFIEAYLDATEA